MDWYTLSRKWFNFCFDNPEKITPWHSAVYFFAIEHCNRLGWKEKFWFPSQMVMEAVWIRNWRTYSKYLNDLVDWGFILMIEKSKNQYSSNIIAIVKNTKAPTKALDKALQKHSTKHSQSIASINKQETKNKETKNKYGEYKNILLTLSQKNKLIEDYGEVIFLDYVKIVDEWIQMKGYKYKDHNLVIRKWIAKDKEKWKIVTAVSNDYEKQKAERLKRYGIKSDWF